MGLASPGSYLACLTSCFLCLPRNGPGPGHGALSPLSREVLLPESPQHLWQGAWGELRKTGPWGPCFCPGLPAPPGGGRPPGPGSVPVCLQELPHPVLPVPRPPHVFPAESQRPPHGPPEALCKVGALPRSLGACRRPHKRAAWAQGGPGGSLLTGSPSWRVREMFVSTSATGVWAGGPGGRPRRRGLRLHAERPGPLLLSVGGAAPLQVRCAASDGGGGGSVCG